MRTKIIATTLFLMMTSLMVMAQPERMSKESRERIEAQRVAFITQRLDLTPEEATKFWPIYNTYKKQLMEMRKNFEKPDLNAMSDKEALKLLEDQIRQEQEKLDLKTTMLHDLSEVVPPKKVLKLQMVENLFNKELLRKLQEKRKS